MITSKQASLICLTGLLGLIATQQGCGSDPSAPSGTPSAGAPAAGAATIPMAGAPAGGAPAAVAGAPAAGAPAAGAPAGGGGSGGASAGTGGGSSGTGGGSAGMGTGGGSAGMGTGGAAPTFAAVSALMGSNCAVSMCHDGSNAHANYKTNLYTVLTTPLPGTTDRCAGSTLVVPSNTAGSFLITAITKGGTCPKGGNSIGRMPDNCSTTSANPRACLTTAQIKTITDWVAAGAPM